ncbi:MAG: HD domain-containing protein [Ectothiorhodospiraceae bacterium]|nr:HD domain-containing protein [Ectothiorhodospiraceae bacterium]
MPKKQQIVAEEIQVGKPIAAAAYDDKGRLLLSKGTVVKNQQQLNALVQRGLYRQPNIRRKPAPRPSTKEAHISPFFIVDDLSKRLKGIFTGLLNKNKDMPTRICHLAHCIHIMCARDFDASLGVIHLSDDLEYIHSHPLHVAILCELFASFLNYESVRRERLLVAALTANLGMLSLQSELHHQKKSLTAEQRQKIRNHPQQATQILAAAGVTDGQWLKIVLQHHEYQDGTGYLGVMGDNILEEAAIIALADRYTAMVSPREHRPPISASDGLKSLFLNKGNSYDETLSLVLIKMLGVFPPGSFVKLENGETAVVIKRPVQGMWPTVKSIITPQGSPINQPLLRNCNDDRYRIKELYTPAKLPPLNPSALWGYKN